MQFETEGDEIETLLAAGDEGYDVLEEQEAMEILALRLAQLDGDQDCVDELLDVDEVDIQEFDKAFST